MAIARKVRVKKCYIWFIGGEYYEKNRKNRIGDNSYFGSSVWWYSYLFKAFCK